MDGHVCPEGTCKPCGVGRVNWRHKSRACKHCGSQKPRPDGFSTCEKCYDTIQVRYLDRRCMTKPCTHRVAVA